MIGLFGDDPNDYMAKWLHKNGVNVLCMSPGKHNYSHVNCPLERIETAIKWLMAHGNRKVGIMGMSTAGMEAIAAASYKEYPDECEATRKDVDRRLSSALHEWVGKF